VGLVIGALYLANGRKLWTLMVAHASFDLTAAAMIYLNLETRVAHLVFS
jgi:membrane protease YdiL (CAAX protease family)